MMPVQNVKPHVQTNKSNFLDAEAIAEAVQRPRMRFVPIKTEKQLDLQALHRVRERWQLLTCCAAQFEASIDCQVSTILAQL
jgi:transposase